MDEVLGFNIDNLYEQLYESIPDDISELKRERDQARINKDWARSDSLREQIEKQGYLVEDRPYETYVRRTFSLLVK
jgi:cysteinyl-tRNA synthetase